LLVVVVLLGAFLAGMAGVVIYSLRGEELKVPEVVGKEYSASEKELAALGLKIKKRATRYSQEAPNTILEQSPKAGETVKTGIPIFVTVARSSTEGDETPFDLNKGTDENTAKPTEPDDDNAPVNTALTKKDKPKKDPKKANTNANSAANKPGSGNTAGTGENKNSGTSNNGAAPAGTPKPNADTPKPPAANKLTPAKPAAAPPDGRPRRNP
jgi:beta-lactam-binding protein with PASTA domain